jgi:predicted acylesterase/phospholipase RssA
MREFSSIVLSGGAFKAISIIGVIQYLEEKNLIKNLKNFIGTSAGALLCFTLALGFSSIEMTNLLYDIIKMENVMQFSIEDFCDIMDTYGIDSGERLEFVFKKILHQKLFRKDITFLEFAKITGKNLVICVTNLTKEHSEYWSVDATPNISVIQALRASCSLPLIFSPVKFNDNLYIDGGLYNNFPISYLNKDAVFKDVIGVNIVSNNYRQADTFIQYIRFMIYSVMEKINIRSINDYSRNVVTLDFEDDEVLAFEEFVMKISNEKINKCIKFGYEKAKECLAKE